MPSSFLYDLWRTFFPAYLILCGTKKLNGHQYIAVNLASVVDRTSLILNYDLERLKIDPTYVSEVFPKIKAAQTLSLGIPTDLF